MKILSVGAIGDDVGDLQRKLQTVGLEIRRSEIQRKFFGPSTRAAVTTLQKANGLQPTGDVRSDMIALMMKPTAAVTAQSGLALSHSRHEKAPEGQPLLVEYQIPSLPPPSSHRSPSAGDVEY